MSGIQLILFLAKEISPAPALTRRCARKKGGIMVSQLISIIIPTYNEAENIGELLQQLAQVPLGENKVEIIVVDGGSSDRTLPIINEFISKSTGTSITENPHPLIKLISTNPGRANQMNQGAKAAQGEILLFLHADSHLPNNFPILITQTLNFSPPFSRGAGGDHPRLAKPTIAGAFELEIRGNLGGLRLVEKFVNWRSHFLSLPYGDQAIFLRAETFWELGGFPDLPIMEDFQLVQQLKKLGRIAIVPAKVQTSPRRWQKLGVWQTTLINQLVIIAFFLGISPQRIANFYRRQSIRKRTKLG